MTKILQDILFCVVATTMALHNDRCVARSPHAATGRSKQYGRPFRDVPDRRDVAIYQVNMRAFSAAGNFAGVAARLDSIKDLGVNVIYLMPIYPVGIEKSVNSPYCVRDYLAINTEFGDLADLRALVDGAHKRNMSVILDWVGNHTAWDNVWMADHRDWYKQDAAGKVVPAGFGWTDVAQLDFTKTAMRQAMIAAMKYWVFAANIDGFRCDYADGPPEDFWKQAIDTLRAIKTHKLLFLAEGSRNGNFTAGFDYNFGFHFFENLESIYNKGKSVLSIDILNYSDYKDAADGQQMVRYTTNHDVNGSDGTPLKLFGGKEGSMAAFVVAACMKGVPMIYGGQEKGMAQPIPFPFTSVKINWNANQHLTEVYKKIIEIRNQSYAIRRGTLTSYSSADICSFTKIAGKETIFILSNMRDKKIDYNLPDFAANPAGWTDLMTGRKIMLQQTLPLSAYSYMILRKNGQD